MGSHPPCCRTISSEPFNSESDSNSSILRVLKEIDAQTEFVVVGQPSNTLVVVIPGNPGFPKFYEDYMKAMHRESQGRVWCISMGHLGHCKGLSGSHLFNLDHQIAHKVHIIKELLARYADMQIVLAGHSVGAHICIEAMRYLPLSRIINLFAICPTVLHIGTTPNGRRVYPLTKYTAVRRGISHAVHAIFALPFTLRTLLMKFWADDVPDHMFATLHGQFDGTVAENILWMAKHEMEEIKDLDEAHARSIQDILVFIFAHEDGWVTNDHEEDLMAICPKATFWKAEPEDGIVHAFTLKSSLLVGRKTVEHFKNRL